MKKLTAILFVVLGVCCFCVGCDEKKNDVPMDGEIVVKDEFEIDFTEEYIIERLALIPTIKELEFENIEKGGDATGTLSDCFIRVFFSSSMIDQEGFEGDTVAEKGTGCGGSIEVFNSVQKAMERDEYLNGGFISLLSPGTHKVRSNVVVRISEELSDTQQKELEDLIYAVLTSESAKTLENISSYDFKDYEELDSDYGYEVEVITSTDSLDVEEDKEDEPIDQAVESENDTENNSDKKTFTVSNCKELKEILTGEYSEEECIEFAKKYDGCILELDAKMIYTSWYDDSADSNYEADFFAYIDGKSIGIPDFYDSCVSPYRNGFKAFEQPDNSDEYKVHVKLRLHSFNEWMRQFNIDVVEVAELKE